MIRTWLAQNAGVTPLVERVTVLEQELADARTMITALQRRVAAAEAHDAAAAGMHDRLALLDRRIRVLARVARAGTNRLRHLMSATLDHAASGKRVDKELERMNAAIAIVEVRIEAEAEQARLATLGLFRQIEAVRPGDRTGRAG
jgi:predicted  nucleic acid-binding Zn-ribbon protein